MHAPHPTCSFPKIPRLRLRVRGLVYALAVWFGIAGLVNGAEDLSKRSARSSPAWLRDAVVYEINTRNFSPEGTFNAVTARLDELRDLGVNVLWLMPIHPIGAKMKKGSLGSP